MSLTGVSSSSSSQLSGLDSDTLGSIYARVIERVKPRQSVLARGHADQSSLQVPENLAHAYSVEMQQDVGRVSPNSTDFRVVLSLPETEMVEIYFPRVDATKLTCQGANKRVSVHTTSGCLVLYTPDASPRTLDASGMRTHTLTCTLSQSQTDFDAPMSVDNPHR